MNELDILLAKIYTEIANPIIKLLFAAAFVMFFWGILKFFKEHDNEELRNEGKRHMLWGIVGMFIIVAVFGIMRLIANTVGADGATLIPW